MDATQTNTKSSRRLGRGLSGLLNGPVAVGGAAGKAAPVAAEASRGNPDAPGAATGAGGPRLIEVDVTDVTSNPSQPRRSVDEGALAGLAESIKASGVMQPIAVRASERGGATAYEIVAGERRWRAAKMAGLARIPAVVVTLDDRASAEWALVENVQREDLNPIDCGLALRGLSERFGLTQVQIAERTGLDRSSIANLMRLTELEDEVCALIAGGALSAGHGKALLSAAPGASRIALAKACAEQGWSVRRLEAGVQKLAQDAGGGSESGAVRELTRSQAAARDLEKRLGDHLGTRVRVKTDGTGKRGKVTLEFYDLDQLEGLLKRMGLRVD